MHINIFLLESGLLCTCLLVRRLRNLKLWDVNFIWHIVWHEDVNHSVTTIFPLLFASLHCQTHCVYWGRNPVLCNKKINQCIMRCSYLILCTFALICVNIISSSVAVVGTELQKGILNRKQNEKTLFFFSLFAVIEKKRRNKNLWRFSVLVSLLAAICYRPRFYASLSESCFVAKEW